MARSVAVITIVENDGVMTIRSDGCGPAEEMADNLVKLLAAVLANEEKLTVHLSSADGDAPCDPKSELQSEIADRDHEREDGSITS